MFNFQSQVHRLSHTGTRVPVLEYRYLIAATEYTCTYTCTSTLRCMLHTILCYRIIYLILQYFPIMHHPCSKFHTSIPVKQQCCNRLHEQAVFIMPDFNATNHAPSVPPCILQYYIIHRVGTCIAIFNTLKTWTLPGRQDCVLDWIEVTLTP